MARVIKIYKNGNIGIWSTQIDNRLYKGPLQGAKDFFIQEAKEKYEETIIAIQNNFPNGRYNKDSKGNSYNEIEGYYNKNINKKPSP